MYDIAIIGGGPAGISSAIHSARFGLKVILFERNRIGGQALSANIIKNYPGFPSGISGVELMKYFANQFEVSGTQFEARNIEKVTSSYGHYIIKANKANRGEFSARNLIIAIGLAPILLDDSMNLGQIHYYPIPADIPHEGKKVLIIGGGDSAFDEAISFSKKARSVTIAMRSKAPSAYPGLVEMAHSCGVICKTGLTTRDIKAMEAEVFVACIGKRPKLDIINGLADMDRVYLIGDLLHPDVRHIATAVGDGVTAVEKIARCK